LSVVLGVNDGHNASACLLVDGRLVAAVQEERLTRVKNQGGLPALAIDEVLRLGGHARADVDVFAFSDLYLETGARWDRDAVLATFASHERQRARSWLRRAPPVHAVRKRQLRAARERALVALGFARERTTLVEHHRSHAAAALHASGWSDGPTLVLTADGVGDYLSATVTVAEDGALRRIREVDAIHSLGTLYARVTYLMGMVPLEHEHKVMGLAPYGARNAAATQRVADKLRALFVPSVDGTAWSSRVDQARPLRQLRDLLDRERFDVVAAGLQRATEDLVLSWVEACVRATGVRRVALAGGLFMNVKVDQRVLASPEVRELYVLPSCGDETNSLGAAFDVAAARGDRIEPLRDLYLGADVRDEDAEKALRSADLPPHVTWRRMADPAREVAALLAQGKVVARAAGRAEFGARALGNRSILADPRRIEVVARINDAIKSRDFWMPFAPALPEERSDEYVAKPKPMRAPYMVLAFDARPDKLAALRAATHPADGTARVQEVPRDWAPEYHAILKRFGEATGDPVLLNTSFNLHGFPIVETAQDALDVFLRSGLDELQLAGFLVSKHAKRRQVDAVAPG
jgi:carbamoyltransferase